jgi:drug/metabolite transporter (DMT)-like permease
MSVTNSSGSSRSRSKSRSRSRSRSRSSCGCAQITHVSSESYGLFLLLISALLFSVMGCYLKLASNTGVPSTQLVFMRSLFQGTIVFVGLCTQRQKQTEIDIENETETRGTNETENETEDSDSVKPPPKLLICNPFGTSRRVIRVVALRGFFGGLGFINYFFSIKALPLGDAITLFSLYPIHTLFLAYFFLGEKIWMTHIIATVASVAGALFIAGPSFLFPSSSGELSEKMNNHTNYNPIGYITAVLGSFFGALVITLICKAGTLGVTAIQLIFSWAVFSAIFSLLFGYVIFDKIEGQWIVPPNTTSWLYILAVCIIGSIAHFLLNYAGRISPAGLSSIVRSSDILFAYVGQIWVFGEVPTIYTIVGVLFVLSSLVVVALQKYNDEKNNNRNDNRINDDNCYQHHNNDHENDEAKISIESNDHNNNNGNDHNSVDEEERIELTRMSP